MAKGACFIEGEHVWQRVGNMYGEGVCVMKGSMHGGGVTRRHVWQGGYAWQACMAEVCGGVCVWWGGHVWQGGHATTEAGGTHPTGIHSCDLLCSQKSFFFHC